MVIQNNELLLLYVSYCIICRGSSSIKVCNMYHINILFVMSCIFISCYFIWCRYIVLSSMHKPTITVSDDFVVSNRNIHRASSLAPTLSLYFRSFSLTLGVSFFLRNSSPIFFAALVSYQSIKSVE